MVKRKDNESKQLRYNSRLTDQGHQEERRTENKHKEQTKIKRIHLNQLQNEYDESANVNFIQNEDSAVNHRSKFSFEIKGISILKNYFNEFIITFYITESRLFNKDIDYQVEEINSNRVVRKLKNRHERYCIFIAIWILYEIINFK